MMKRLVSPGIRAKAGAGRRAFTLLEAVLALGLSIVVLSGIFGFYELVLKAREEGTTTTRDIKMARSILAGLAGEIRHTTSIVPGDGIGFRGDRNKITIVKLGLPDRYAYNKYDPMVDKLPPAQLDLQRITYELLWDEEKKDKNDNIRICHGLWRTEQKTFDPNPSFVVKEAEVAGLSNEDNAQISAPQAEGELYAPEVQYLEFAYFDGAQWRDRWQFSEDTSGGSGTGAGGAGGQGGVGPMGSGYALPQAVRITIGKVREDPDNDMFDLNNWKDFEEHPDQKPYYPDRFTIVVPLLEADQTLLSSRQYGTADSLARQEGGPAK